MKVIITCGHPESGYQTLHGIMTRSGLKDANTQNVTGLRPQELHQKICETYKLDTTFSQTLTQIQPGKFWEHAAMDMFMGNVDQEHWGWADPNSIFLLDYWRDYEANTRFLLVYNSPNTALAQVLEKLPATPEAAEEFLHSWYSYNDALLRFYLRNQSRCILVNSEAVSSEDGDLHEIITNGFGLALSNTAPTQSSSVLNRPNGELARLIIESLRPDPTETDSLYQELEASADLPVRQPYTSPLLPAWTQYSTLVKELDESRDAAIEALRIQEKILQENDEKNRKNEELRAELKQLETRLTTEADSLSKSLSSLEAEKKLLEQKIQEHDRAAQHALDNKEHQKTQEELDRLEAEQHLRTLQLHQVQEELMFYFEKCQELEASRETIKPQAAPAPVPRKGFALDMRSDIEGTHWHEPEHDGRWAGPANSSTIITPPLEAGNYRLELDIVDAMSQEIINGMGITHNGSALKLYIPQQEKGIFRKRLRFPILATASFEVTKENENKNNTFNLNFPTTLSPSERGEPDNRSLTIRVKTVIATKVGSNTYTPPKGQQQTPVNLTIDLREQIEGTNWYEAENDGRWAGPEAHSTIALPNLPAGSYQLSLQIVDAMSADILKNSTLAINGTTLKLKRADSEQPLLRRMVRKLLRKPPKYPFWIHTNIELPEAPRQRNLNLEFDFPKTISPQERGENDARKLALRLQKIRLTETP